MDQSQHASAWRLHETHATLHTAQLLAHSNLQHTEAGFQSQQPCPGLLWQVTTPLDRQQPRPLLESYLRESDLIANYGTTPSFPFATQTYWRLLHQEECMTSIATILSVQTDLLDTHPVMEISCELLADEVFLIPASELNRKPIAATSSAILPREGGAQLLLIRLSGTDNTFAEAIDPADFCSLELNTSKPGRVRCTWQLFSHFLEKGVIRRGRLCTMIVPRENDIEQAIRGFRKFLASELPLTA